MIIYQTTWCHILQDNNGNTKIQKNIKTNGNPSFRKWYCESILRPTTQRQQLATCWMPQCLTWYDAHFCLSSWLSERPSTSVILICWMSLSSLCRGRARKYCTKINLLLAVMVIKTMLWKAQKVKQPKHFRKKKKEMSYHHIPRLCYGSRGDPPFHLCDQYNASASLFPGKQPPVSTQEETGRDWRAGLDMVTSR
jgi:hypothetical protein